MIIPTKFVVWGGGRRCFFLFVINHTPTNYGTMRLYYEYIHKWKCVYSGRERGYILTCLINDDVAPWGITG